ncbi:MAG: hypothetical protein IPO85_13330 [Saprospiraceae bacterium]|uniref:Uncharacterized protein n=1 Tax=Candidatus Defluviibacterium haderslevense TaxID=2981993 RepID=A0A9D7XF39_9BACT|nr:hypothetical protein [Candidatus Defluviibacterium haderslevense]
MKIILLLIACIIVIFLLYSFAKNKYEEVKLSKEIQYGPFTIQAKVSKTKNFNMNYGRMTNNTNVAYHVLYNGKPITYSSGLQNNTGLPFLWAVYALKDAPDPTLIAGSQSLYMIYIRDGVPKVEPLLIQGTDFASLQFLDCKNGQPGDYSEVFMKSETTQLEELDRLEGGRFLMVSEHAILDVQTRKIWSMNKDNNPVENYSYPSPHGALAFSPDQKCIVFHAEFQSWNTQDENLPDSEHALVVYHFEKDSGYAVKYDDTDTRMTNVNDINYDWVNTYFEWKKFPEGDRLELRSFKQLPNWSGKFDPKDHYYTLYPVKPEMLAVFLNFVFEQMAWTKSNIIKDETGEYTGHSYTIGSEDLKLDIGFKEDEQKLTFSKYLYDDKNTESDAVVKKIALAFNAELNEGKHQELFGRIFSETKKIRGVK